MHNVESGRRVSAEDALQVMKRKTVFPWDSRGVGIFVAGAIGVGLLAAGFDSILKGDDALRVLGAERAVSSSQFQLLNRCSDALY